MQRNFRFQFFSWLLLVLFSYNIVGCYATFFAWKLWMHEQLESLASTLPNEQLTLIKLSSTEKIDNEIAVDGKMFDIVRTSKNNGITYCYCIRDFEEETLATTISDNEHFAKAHNDLAKAIKTLKKKNGEKYTPAFTPDFYSSEHPLILMRSEQFNRIFTGFISKYSPPPQA